MECVPCESGQIYNANNQAQKCQDCKSSNFCPVGTKYEFPKSKFKPRNFEDISIKNVPETFVPEEKNIDQTASMVFVIWIFLAVFIVIVIIFMNALCREKSLFIFRELDLTPITGGQ